MLERNKQQSGGSDRLEGAVTLIDLTHTLDETIPTWNGGCGFNVTTFIDYSDCVPDGKGDTQFRVQRYTMNAGIGTHIDAPAHCIPGGKCVSELLLTDLYAPLIVIDLASPVHEQSLLTIADIERFEEAYGTIQAGSFVFVRTGWDCYWHDREKYHNKHLFPAVSLEAAELLVQRGIVGLGIDTLSPDRPEDGFRVHQLVLGAGKYIVENIAAHGTALPPVGAHVMILPLKVGQGTEAPARVVAFV